MMKVYTYSALNMRLQVPKTELLGVFSAVMNIGDVKFSRKTVLPSHYMIVYHNKLCGLLVFHCTRELGLYKGASCHVEFYTSLEMRCFGVAIA